MIWNMSSSVLGFVSLAALVWLAACTQPSETSNLGTSGAAGTASGNGAPASGDSSGSAAGQSTGPSGSRASGSGASAGNATGVASGASRDVPDACPGAIGDSSVASGGGSGAAVGGTPDAGVYMPPPPKPSAGCGKLTPGGDQVVRMNGRTFTVSPPGGYNPKTPHRVVFSHHGCGGGVAWRLPGLAPVIHVFPIGGDGACYDDQTRASPEYVFFDQILNYVETNYCVDEERIFATGDSSGAWMSIVLGCQRANVVRAHSQTAGGLPIAIRPATDCKGPEAALFIHDTLDGNNTINGGRQARDRLIKANGCSTDTQAWDIAPCVTYQGCLPGYPVVWCQTMGLGHSDNPGLAIPAMTKFFAQF